MATDRDRLLAEALTVHGIESIRVDAIHNLHEEGVLDVYRQGRRIGRFFPTSVDVRAGGSVSITYTAVPHDEGETMTIELGKRYRDTLSGFEGVATARFEFLHGCVRWQLTGVVNGEPKEYVFDEPQLEATASEETHAPTRGRGGPRPAPPRTGLA